MADEHVWHAIDRLVDHIAVLGVRFAAGEGNVARGSVTDDTVQRAGSELPHASAESTVVRPNLRRLYKFLKDAPGLHGWRISGYSPQTREIFGSSQFKSVRRNGMSSRNISIRRTQHGNFYVLRFLNLGKSRGLTFREKTDQGVRDQLDVYFPPIHDVSTGYSGLSLGKEMEYTKKDGSVRKVDVEDGVKTLIDSDDGEEYELESVSSNDDDGAQEGEGEGEEGEEEDEEDGEEGEEEHEEDGDSDG